MEQTALLETLRLTWGFQADSDLYFEDHGAKVFRVAEVRPDGSVAQSIAGKIGPGSTITSEREPDLTFQQARLYSALLERLDERLSAAEADRKQEALLWACGEESGLYRPLTGEEPSLAGSAREGLLPVHIAVELYALLRGWQITPKVNAKGEWRIYAIPLDRFE